MNKRITKPVYVDAVPLEIVQWTSDGNFIAKTSHVFADMAAQTLLYVEPKPDRVFSSRAVCYYVFQTDEDGQTRFDTEHYILRQVDETGSAFDADGWQFVPIGVPVVIGSAIAPVPTSPVRVFPLVALVEYLEYWASSPAFDSREVETARTAISSVVSMLQMVGIVKTELDIVNEWDNTQAVLNFAAAFADIGSTDAVPGDSFYDDIDQQAWRMIRPKVVSDVARFRRLCEIYERKEYEQTRTIHESHL